ncbi:hypothetical protein [Serratia symbiotica]|uniref:Uncharacterized protein n=1 Tax=Serratia symbiotica TaxID=138074 RepID=A0A7D5SM81_9GAMM|nr:hypothetical protein [Serratia symbiotica]MBF1996408.1 hypothetical protein [Serratia symbiotica]MBQ0954686.1 hypothetical protein [Serratia symbiotica]QLH63716.1 hypothetical protein SYMBAF_13315 [Serratia symbiotica]QTP14107.1 hypothetical protein GPZ83_0012115 [Serratia symbiotica]
MQAGWFALNVLVPVSDISQVGRYTGRNVARLWQCIQTVTSCWSVDDYHPANWPQAVVDSGLPAIGLLLMLVTVGGSVSPTG